MADTERAEHRLSYASGTGSEHGRKRSGSYYTPPDVASFFWDQFFSLGGIDNPAKAGAFVTSHGFVEPSAGSGILIHALLLKLVEIGVDAKTITDIDLTAFDTDPGALGFVKNRMQHLSQTWGRNLPNVRFIQKDFLRTSLDTDANPRVFFGNPPYVPNKKRGSQWRNLFADFVEVSLNHMGETGRLHFIVPLSLAFGRDYANLRTKMKERNRIIAVSNFDNIPDTLFRFGKPKNTNSNKWNSQRCSILTLMPTTKTRIRSTRLIRWTRGERRALLSRPPEYHDVTPYLFDGQIPRPENARTLRYLGKAMGGRRLHDLLSKNGRHRLHVAAVARNYIGIREKEETGTHRLDFRGKDDFHRALLIISSDLFFAYWRTVGDGFHVTKRCILDFPVNNELARAVNALLPSVSGIWADRAQCLKTKLNSARRIRSYDFSARTPSLLGALPRSRGRHASLNPATDR